jgi:type 1 glutamine amidotransferase
MWPKVHFRVMSTTSKITKRDKQMYLIWTVPITHLSHAFIQCCASFPLLRWEYYSNVPLSSRNISCKFSSSHTWHKHSKFHAASVWFLEINLGHVTHFSSLGVVESAKGFLCKDFQCIKLLYLSIWTSLQNFLH